MQRLQEIPEISQHYPNRNRDAAITAFAFYRVLYAGVIQKLKSAKIGLENMDAYILIKRIPLKLYYYLGDQYWRVYELCTVIDGELPQLYLNADIKDLLIRACGEANQSEEGASCQAKPNRSKEELEAELERELESIETDEK